MMYTSSWLVQLSWWWWSRSTKALSTGHRTTIFSFYGKIEIWQKRLIPSCQILSVSFTMVLFVFFHDNWLGDSINVRINGSFSSSTNKVWHQFTIILLKAHNRMKIHPTHPWHDTKQAIYLIIMPVLYILYKTLQSITVLTCTTKNLCTIYKKQ